MSTYPDIKDFVFAQDDLPEEGANIRVRPEPVRTKVYGQGIPLSGPKLNGKVFPWSAPLVVDSTCDADRIGDPDNSKIHPDAVAQTRNYL